MENMSVKELKEMAKELKVKDWWNLKKSELIKGIQEAQKSTQNDEATEADEVIEENESADQNEPETTEKKPRGKMIEYNGKAQSLNAWAKELGFTPQTLYARLYISNWPVEKAFETVSRRKKTEEEA